MDKARVEELELLFYEIRNELMVPGQAYLRRQYDKLGVLIRKLGADVNVVILPNHRCPRWVNGVLVDD